MNRAAYVFRLNHRLDTARAIGVVAIGWYRLPSLSDDWDGVKSALLEAYPDLYTGNARGLGNAAGSVWRFAHDMKKGDLALIPVEKGFHVAQIEGDPEFRAGWANDDDDMAWSRAATWLTKEPISRLTVGNALQMRLKSRQTIVDASDCLDDVCARLEGRTLPTLLEFVRERSRDAIVEGLTRISNPDQLERIVADLLRSQGALTARVREKNQGMPGDVDVVAEWAPVVPGDRGFKVAVQVKQHEGVSGIHGIRQLVDRASHETDIDRWIFVSTAAELATDARAAAERANILVLMRDDLADWILSRGLDALYLTSPS